MEWRHIPTTRKITFNNVSSAQKMVATGLLGGELGGLESIILENF